MLFVVCMSEFTAQSHYPLQLYGHVLYISMYKTSPVEKEIDPSAKILLELDSIARPVDAFWEQQTIISFS